MFFLHARFPLRLDWDGWEGAPSLDLVGFLAACDDISVQVKLNFLLAYTNGVLRNLNSSYLAAGSSLKNRPQALRVSPTPQLFPSSYLCSELRVLEELERHCSFSRLDISS